MKYYKINSNNCWMLMVHWGFPDLGLEHGWIWTGVETQGDREMTRSKVEPFSAEVQGRFGGRTQPLLSRRILSRASRVQEARRWILLIFQTGGLELVHKAKRSHRREEWNDERGVLRRLIWQQCPGGMGVGDGWQVGLSVKEAATVVQAWDDKGLN